MIVRRAAHQHTARCRVFFVIPTDLRLRGSTRQDVQWSLQKPSDAHQQQPSCCYLLRPDSAPCLGTGGEMGARFHAQERSQRLLLPQERKLLGRPRDADDEYRSLVVVVVLRVVVGEKQ